MLFLFSMQVTLLGSFDEHYFARAVKDLELIFSVPQRAHLYVLDHQRHCQTILRHLPSSERASFKQICRTDNVSFSYRSQRHRLIVLVIGHHNSYLLRDVAALQGLLFHEFFHLEQMEKGAYASIQQSYRKILRLYAKLLTHLHQKKFISVLEPIGRDAVFLLKDLYANSLLLERGYGDYLLHYYEQEFSLKKICPRPVFYERLQQAVRKDPRVLEIVVTFEFALLSMILPFKKYQTSHAKKLLSHLAQCYNLNMRDLLRKCKPFMDFYLDHYHKPSKAFQEHYLHLIFTKVIALLT